MQLRISLSWGWGLCIAQCDRWYSSTYTQPLRHNTPLSFRINIISDFWIWITETTLERLTEPKCTEKANTPFSLAFNLFLVLFNIFFCNAVKWIWSVVCLVHSSRVFMAALYYATRCSTYHDDGVWLYVALLLQTLFYSTDCWRHFTHTPVQNEQINISMVFYLTSMMLSLCKCLCVTP